VDGFAYRAKVHNASAKLIEIIFCEYQFKEAPDSTIMTRRQFLCGVSIKPERDKELQAFSLSGLHDVVSVDALAGKSAVPGEEKVVINRVEFADGTIWAAERLEFRRGATKLRARGRNTLENRDVPGPLRISERVEAVQF
jgi:hypothetical protein